MSTSILPLQLQHVDYHIGQSHLLKNLDLKFEAGALSVILGANGAGKTLLLKLCCGLIQATQGQLIWANKTQRAKGQPLPYTLVFHKPVLLHRSVYENLLFALPHLSHTQTQARIEDALQWAGIEHLADKHALTLSTGQQQIVAIARAWAGKPEVLFLDEPTANLDPDASERMESLIADLHRKGTKIVMSTHNLAQAKRLADEVIFIEQGRIGEHRKAEDFFATPTCEGAQRFLSVQGF